MKTFAAAVLLLVSTTTFAGPLLRPRFEAGAPAGERSLDLDHAALHDLRTRGGGTLEGFPLGTDTATLDVHRIEPFGKDLRIEVDGPLGLTTMPAPPDVVYFGGTVVGSPRSVVFLAATPDSVHGFVVRDDQTFPFGPRAGGGLRSYALADVDPNAHPGPSDFCANDLHPELPVGHPALRSPSVRAEPAPAKTTTDMLEVQVAVDTDTELLAKPQFPTLDSATAYLTDLFAASNAIYEQQVHVHLKLNYIRLRSASDPWTATDTIGQLNEVQAYWQKPANGMPNASNDVVHF